MADLFISYAREDELHAENIRAYFLYDGYTVSWDEDISGGTLFREEIVKEIRSAIQVIVIWSKDAVKSHYVIDEAALARDLGKLLPVRLLNIDANDIPLGFRSFQTVPYWDGEAYRIWEILKKKGIHPSGGYRHRR